MSKEINLHLEHETNMLKAAKCHNERPEREITKFLETPDGYVPDRPVHCIRCSNLVIHLRDQLSIQEFIQSGMCQECQDTIWSNDKYV